MPTPDRSLDQRRAALIEANRIRVHRAALKRDLAALRKDLSDILADPDCATMKLFDALLALPRVGRVKANRIIKDAKISPSKTIGGLTQRQRADLRAAMLEVSPRTVELERLTRRAGEERAA